MKRILDRRTVLRGLLGGSAVSVSLPMLEAMLDTHGEALATGAPLPDRFGVWFWGNGIRPERFTPSGISPWTPSAELAPLADLVPYVSVVSGCTILVEPYHPHHTGMVGIMTGATYLLLGSTGANPITTPTQRSVDQIAADAFEGQTPFRSIEAGVCQFMGTEGGSTFQHLSHNGPNNPNPSEYSPSALYQRMFGFSSPEVNFARRSVIDAVLDQSLDLRKRLSRHDALRLDQHLDSMRALELRLANSSELFCDPGTPPVDVAVDGPEPIAEKNVLMSQVMALALACDVTRAFTVQFSTCGSATVFWPAGVSEGMHMLCHGDPYPQENVHAVVVYIMEQLAVFLRTLRDTPDGAGNLLDHCSLLCTSEHSDGLIHSYDDFPLLVAGLGNGRLRGGVHVPAQPSNKRNASEVVLTVLRGAGIDAPSYGEEAAYTESTVTELET